MNKSLIATLLTTVLMLSACGGGGSSSSSTDTGNTGNTGNTGGNTTVGGTLANPTTIEINKKYSLVTNNYYNYFAYSGQDEDTIFLKANYDLPFTTQQRSRCSANWKNEPTFKIYDNKGGEITGECTDNLIFKLPESQPLVFQLVSANRGNGELFTTVVHGDSAISNPTGISRSPSNPAAIVNINQLNQNSFYNYFKYSGKAGETINISVLLDSPLTAQQKSRCSASGGYGASSYSTGLKLYDDSYNEQIGVCGTELKYTFNSDGTYILGFNFEGAGNNNGGGIGTGTVYFESLVIR